MLSVHPPTPYPTPIPQLVAEEQFTTRNPIRKPLLFARRILRTLSE